MLSTNLSFLKNSTLALPEIPVGPGKVQSWYGLSGASMALTLATITQRHSGITLVIVPDTVISDRLEEEIAFFNKALNNELPILRFSDWETLPYDTFSPHPDIISERLTTLFTLSHLKQGLLIVPISTLMQKICPKHFVTTTSFKINVGDNWNVDNLPLNLGKNGYRRVAQVVGHGEFAIRGSILDLYPMGSEQPFRIDFFGNTIDSIRYFDPESQRSLNQVDHIALLSAHEFPFHEEAISEFRTRWRTRFEGDPKRSPIYKSVSDGLVAAGLEYYLPLFFESLETLLNYIEPSNTLVVKVEPNRSQEQADAFWEQIKKRHDQYGHDIERPLLSPEELYNDPETLLQQLKDFPQIKLFSSFEKPNKQSVAMPVQALPDLSLEARHEKPLHRLETFLKDTFKSTQGKCLLCVESAGREEVLKELLKSVHIDFKPDIVIAPLDAGMYLSIDPPLCLITEQELMGHRVMQRRRRKSKAQSQESVFGFRSLAELNINDPVVHIHHGIGRYLGLTKLTLGSVDKQSSGSDNQPLVGEFLTIGYAENDKLYVPVTSLHLISRYASSDRTHAPIHRLGGPEWQKTKRKVLEQTRDVAAELLDIYAKREAAQGEAFREPDEHYEAFAAEFPFEETEDQEKAIHEVLSDLTRPKPMDRLVCGDVGFGKTEVALRAAFLVANNGKQVAVLVPTTLLAAQHYQTFTDRFAGFPVRIEMLSRFRSAKEQEKIIEGVKEGKIDIIIGTHKLLQKSIQFKSLGLLIIDEEHRFGVHQKETFKAFRSQVDILTLTATPIPRTLNMAMASIRDLSIIATPPAKRLSIKTFVREKHPALITEAILRELHRGGQVYYLHNTVETIEREAEHIMKLVPSARIAIAHGQLREKELEQIMSDFYHRRYNVLVCTTIIETGIDVPTANTIIIDRADQFGLAQLHQLRGRVGRSHHQAYAFCMVPPKTKLSSDADKRLEAISSFDELGAGFVLASQDLEIRGAGELLGESQSGHMEAVGFSLYMELLEHAVRAMKSGKNPTLEMPLNNGTEIDLQIPCFIPETYIADVQTRLVFYKRIANAESKEALDELMVELIDRFGSHQLPQEVRNLFKITEIKLQAGKLGIVKIEMGAKGGKFEFDAKPHIDPLKIIDLIQKQPHIYKLEGPQKLRIKMDLSDRDKRIEMVAGIIAGLGGR